MSREKLNEDYMPQQKKWKKIKLAKKCMLFGADPGKRANFTICLLLVMFVLNGIPNTNKLTANLTF
jgi:hypothetical protein